jgi:hypothetical protein
LAQLTHNWLKVGSHRQYLQAHCQSRTSRRLYQSFGKELANKKLENLKIFLQRAVARKIIQQHDKFGKIPIPRQFSGTETNK